MRSRTAFGLLLAASLVPTALAQNTKPSPRAKDKPADAQPAAPAWPKKVEKQLYAKDLRGEKAPALSVQETLTGKLPDTKGKVVLIDFWATWCPPCRKGIPELNELQKKFKDDLVVIGISDETASKVRDFMKKTPMEYTVAVDPSKKMNAAVEVQGIPQVLIVSTDGVVRWQGFPLSDEEPLTEAIVKQIIDADPGVKARHEAASKEPKADQPSEEKRAPEKHGKTDKKKDEPKK
jgi:cytochrome c biogenesis protein CcmG/thiol:disulfide interchange protein DsbE